MHDHVPLEPELRHRRHRRERVRRVLGRDDRNLCRGEDGVVSTSTQTLFAPQDTNVSSATMRATDTIPATVVLAALSVITAIGFCRVFSGWDSLAPLLVVVLLTHVVCLG